MGANAKINKKKIKSKEVSLGMKKYQEMHQRVGLNNDQTPLTKNSSHSIAVSANRSSMQTMARLESMGAISSMGAMAHPITVDNFNLPHDNTMVGYGWTKR